MNGNMIHCLRGERFNTWQYVYEDHKLFRLYCEERKPHVMKAFYCLGKDQPGNNKCKFKLLITQVQDEVIDSGITC